MDDVQEKARRNLVVFSAAILGSALLDLSIVSTVIGVKVTNSTSPIVFWLCVAAVLAYLAARFHLAPDLREGKATWQSRYTTPVARAMEAEVIRDFRRVLIEKLPPESIQIDHSSLPKGKPVIGTDEAPPQVIWLGDGNGILSAFFSTYVTNTSRGPEWKDSKKHTVAFRLSPKKHRSFRRQQYLARYKLDWFNLEFQFPRVIASLAALAITIQLVMAYYPYRSPVRFLRWVWSGVLWLVNLGMGLFA
ncbi:hypothetical protein [Achromobacter xylosoxidans]|uniref:hypothetical protein n=1 Tax=Alcaligenes xylosoxydans xylosoxydans TaxID=85698 RepID=UPI0022B8FE7C|nr:hypothetical protein [Achromobacter xylosoxidans]MCZ8437182.1 hypothetical protein [Achromobacter xylosoxidans]